MEDFETKYSLLSRMSEESALEEGEVLNHAPRQTKKLQTLASTGAHFLLLFSLAFNAVFLYNYRDIQAKAYSCISEYTGLGLTTEKPYWQHTDYISSNLTLANSMWESIDTSPSTIALSPSYTQSHNLNSSIAFPWDSSKGLYLIKGIHHIHCLKNIRHAYLQALSSHPGQKQMISSEHVAHCLDTLRQDIMCRPDDTPMPTVGQRHKIGHGQVRKCKDWDALISWTQDPERHACFTMLDEYRRIPNTLEEFQNCRDDSPYKEVADRYFAEHGHRDPFGGLDGTDGEAEERWSEGGVVEEGEAGY